MFENPRGTARVLVASGFQDFKFRQMLYMITIVIVSLTAMDIHIHVYHWHAMAGCQRLWLCSHKDGIMHACIIDRACT